MKTIRDSIPTEAIVRAYLDESVEQEEEEIIAEEVAAAKEKETTEKEEQHVVPEVVPPPSFDAVPAISNMDDKPIVNRLTFDDVDHAITEDGQEEKIIAPKTIERLEEISVERNLQRKLEEEDDDDSDDERLKISEDVSIDLGFTDLNPFEKNNDGEITLDVEEL